MQKSTSLRELAILFFRLGSTSFGGPAVHIAMMEEEVVRRRYWLTHQQFLDMVAATNLIPGPNSTEMAIHIGFCRAGFKGLIVAGVSFIAPAMLIVTALAWLYVHYGTVPVCNAFLYGVKPVVLAVVIQALWRLGRSALKTLSLIGLASLACILNMAGLGEISVLLLAALTSAFVLPLVNLQPPAGLPRIGCWGILASYPLKPALLSTATILSATALTSVSLWQLFIVFLKIGSVLFGSGYVLLAFLRADLVEKLAWLTETQLLDAIAIGQVTPGPVFTTATFIGYLISGPSGALVATVGIFLPAFFFVAISAPLLPYLRRSAAAARVLDGLNAASLALMAVVTIRLGHAAVYNYATIFIVLISSLVLSLTKINSSWLVLGGGVIGVLSNLI